MINRILGSVSGFIIAMSLVSCGGGTDYAEGGIGGTGISSGSVTDYGSIVVNGVHFDTTGAVITKDDGAAVTNVNDADINQFINIGMVVTVKGTINDDGVTGKADSISYDDILEGPVVGTTPADNMINVLGQNVKVVDGVTVYACDESNANCTLSTFSTFANLAEDQVIEVSGFIDQNGDITAAYIELQEDTYPNRNAFELKGYAKNVTTSSSSFTIGGLTIITATDMTGLNGTYVKAKGTLDKTTMILTTNEAVEIESESFDITDADKAELEGIATTGCTTTTPCDFTLSGVTVHVDSNTTFITDSVITGSVADIIAGVKLEAEGKLQGGILYASEIEFK